MTGNWIYGSNCATSVGADSNVGADLLLATYGLDGTEQIGGGMCNGYIDHNRLGFSGGSTALYNLRTYDPDFHITDCFIENNWIEGENSTISNVLIMDGGGRLVRGNHMYAPKYSTSAICIPNNASAFNAGCDLTLQEPNWDTLVADNYFEDSVGYQLSGAAADFSVFGPGNMVGGATSPHSAYFVAGFGNYSNDTTISQGNFYYNAQIIHDYSYPSKVLTSSNDVFSNPQPVIKIGAGQVNLWSLVNNGLAIASGSGDSSTRRIIPQPLNDQKPGAYTGYLANGDLWRADVNSNSADSEERTGKSSRSSMSLMPGKLICRTAQSGIGHCMTKPDDTGSCGCE